jgi:hypothetical protein
MRNLPRLRIFPDRLVVQLEDVQAGASLMEKSLNDQNQPVAAKLVATNK